MTTLSIPISVDLAEFIANQIKNGHASTKAEVVRKAIIMFREHEAVSEILHAQQEPTLRGDLRDLAKKFKHD